ncbi:putative placenta-specific protein 9-like [Scophthalmus maximus]|uniref:Putative placenta-specific protein 9-like n=1 Tax=Scophthalmus maximus TaxID=52904 RepID=A0A2U9CCU4_SCOMX|nr:placenta-specific protein 9 [Scophthalmus maximus]AWP14397.1 putative placenta-specific protein 9-like [Scophthalmus maximus]
MIRPPTSSIGLLLLLIGYAAAGPEPDLRPRAVRSSACQEHMNLHNRLDVVEKKVEDTVEKLEVEIAALLGSIEDPKWSPLLDNAGKTAVDILDEPGPWGPVLN